VRDSRGLRRPAALTVSHRTMDRLGLARDIVDPATHARTVARFKERRIALPTFGELADPTSIPAGIQAALAEVDPDTPHPLNLFRVHWYNAADQRGRAAEPAHVVLDAALTGVRAPIVVLLGSRFPMIHAHKVLAAYGCLAPRVVTGQFDPSVHRAVWPSTGNYCRGGVAISRMLGCRSVAVLPEGMSEERFAWLERWVERPEDIVRTPGTESNVKEIYDRCREIAREPDAVVFNQFCEFGNYLAHLVCTGRALEDVFGIFAARRPGLRAAAFVAATGSAGTLGAGDHLKARHGTRLVAVEALECPTLLYNGFGEHNIQGIGDKHVPLIHNVMNTDVVAAVSDRATDRLAVLFNTEIGREYLRRRGVGPAILARLGDIGLSGLCNIVASIKIAKYFDLGPDDAVLTVATDGAELYRSEEAKAAARHFPEGFDTAAAAEVFGEHLLGAATDHVLELTHRDRTRIFNLGYYTWVEQQGVSVTEFTARRDPGFWQGLRDLVGAWDELIRAFNAETGVRAEYDSSPVPGTGAAADPV
jgi:cysteine synthase A